MKRHTVILGAGATIAAIPNGDKNGRKSSVMNGLIEKLNLHEVLKGIELKTQSDNLEDIYSELHSRPECKCVTEELERRSYYRVVANCGHEWTNMLHCRGCCGLVV